LLALIALMLFLRYKNPKDRMLIQYYTSIYIEILLFCFYVIILYSLLANESEYQIYIVILLSPFYFFTFTFFLRERYETLMLGTSPSQLKTITDVIIKR
jgi:hypothetical protein